MTYSIDQLTYTYKPNSNRLDVVHDNSNSVNGFRDGNFNGTDYQYDDNGNMIIDRNKGIQNISYNHLNLPVEITFSNDGKISYLYNALGSKIKKSVTMPSQVETTDYLGGFQYKNEVLQYFPTAEGYVNVTDGTFFNYVYNYTDHLGNIRLSYTQSGTELKILEENHYYPFGLKHNNYNTDKVQFKKSEFGTSAVLQFAQRNNNQYKYNGKEYQDELNLNWYDYQARNYDPAIGRWMNVDPMAEMSRRWSPYNYCMDNPIFFIDPDGMQVTDIIGATKDDAKKFKADTHKILADSKFDKLRGLIDISGSKFKKVDAKAMGTALEGSNLSTDEQAYVDNLVGAINSKDVHTVEYLSSADNASPSGATAFKDHLNKNAGKGVGDAMLTPSGDLKAATIAGVGGEGLNVPTSNGSHSFIVESPSMTAETRAETSGHEVLGHGVQSANKASNTDNNSNAIRMTNLIRRVTKSSLPQRDGGDHAGGKVTNPSDLPK